MDCKDLALNDGKCLAAPLEDPVKEESFNSQFVTKKELKRMSTDAPGSLETEQSNLEKLKYAFESFGETTKAYQEEMRNIKVRLKEGKEMFEQTEEMLKHFNAQQIQSRFNALTKKNPGDILSRINPGNLNEQLKDMEKRILMAKSYLADSQHSNLKKSIDKYHESLENFDTRPSEPSNQIERMDRANTTYMTRRLLEEANRVVPEDGERDKKASDTIAIMKKMTKSEIPGSSGLKSILKNSSYEESQ